MQVCSFRKIPMTMTEAIAPYIWILFSALLLAVAFALQQVYARFRAIRADIISTQQRMETRFSELIKANNEITGQLKVTNEISIAQRSDSLRTIRETLDKAGHRVNENIATNNERTSETLNRLHERIAIINSAQASIVNLSSQFVTLQETLSDKQQRGAFGQGCMESIIRDMLPGHTFSFQATLSNKNRPDCLISLPNTKEKIVVDAKFPLEAFTAMKKSVSPDHLKEAQKRLRQDVTKHIKDIRERYFIPGETQDNTIMFVPSESVYADLYEHFDDIIQKAYRMRVIIVSPSMLMLSVQVMRSLIRDTQIRQKADLIRDEITFLVEDVHRLRKRALDLQKHFDQATHDVKQVLLSADKIKIRGQKIEETGIEEERKTEDIEKKT
ncbi:MAG: DNA recombination protein RmuC [Alphaproteobacteria bacterium]|nr:DNA recombination protein RmuC [Alphaproteobacteria bacterium]